MQKLPESSGVEKIIFIEILTHWLCIALYEKMISLEYLIFQSKVYGLQCSLPLWQMKKSAYM